MARMSSEERLAKAEECLASGMSVREWSEANGVPAPTVYSWVRRLRDERACGLAPAFVEVAAPAQASPIVVRVGAVEMAVPAGADEREVAAVMRAAASL